MFNFARKEKVIKRRERERDRQKVKRRRDEEEGKKGMQREEKLFLL